MRLGIVMMGTGAYAAACVGALRAVFAHGLDVYAVCGLQDGAWPAAQYVLGYGEAEMEKALVASARAGKKLLRVRYPAKALLGGRKKWLSEGHGLNRLLKIQAGEQLLALCARRGIFPCRLASSGRRVVFSTRAYAQGRDVTLTQQATVGFAARAAMANPPFLSPMPWLGSSLLPEESPAWAADQLIRMGADRVLIIEPRAAVTHEPDALELAAASRRWATQEKMPEGTGILRIAMPVNIGALCFSKMPEISRIGYDAAQAQLDDVLRRMGMTLCRILPFRTRAQQAVSRR